MLGLHCELDIDIPVQLWHSLLLAECSAAKESCWLYYVQAAL